MVGVVGVVQGSHMSWLGWSTWLRYMVKALCIRTGHIKHASRPACTHPHSDLGPRIHPHIHTLGPCMHPSIHTHAGSTYVGGRVLGLLLRGVHGPSSYDRYRQARRQCVCMGLAGYGAAAAAAAAAAHAVSRAQQSRYSSPGRGIEACHAERWGCGDMEAVSGIAIPGRVGGR